MTMPQSPGWYDDPDGSYAERYWNGHNWTPERRRKPAQRQGPTTPHPSDPFQPTYEYPAYQQPAPGPISDPSPDSTASGAVARIRNARGLREIMSGAMALCGLALVAVAFLEWGRARGTATLLGEPIVGRVSFPGVGDVDARISFPGVDWSDPRNVDSFHNTNPGWTAIVIGVLVLAISIGYWRIDYRLWLAVAVAVIGCIGTTVLISDLVDIRGAFGDPAELGDLDFSPGIGLIVAFVLSLATTALGIASAIMAWRAASSESST